MQCCIYLQNLKIKSIILIPYERDFPPAFIKICALGTAVLVGLEDNVYLEKGVLAKSNAEQVQKVAALAKLLGRPIATAKEAREMLNL
ncbi:MAG: 3-keto-5-aminohexanoate cleavage protein [Clostridiales bacterium]